VYDNIQMGSQEIGWGMQTVLMWLRIGTSGLSWMLEWTLLFF